MAAVVDVLSYHGAGPTSTNVRQRTIAWKRADNDDADINDPVPIPDTGTAYSWRKYFKLNVASGLSPGGHIANIRWFADPPPADWSHSVETYVKISSGYTNPATVASGDETAQIAGTADVDDDLAPIDADNPLVVYTGVAITSTGVGAAPYLLQQMGVLDTATAGMKTGRRFVFRYDEV